MIICGIDGEIEVWSGEGFELFMYIFCVVYFGLGFGMVFFWILVCFGGFLCIFKFIIWSLFWFYV